MFSTSSFVWGWTQATIGGLWDRSGQQYLVFDIDATREAARQRKLPTGTDCLPPSGVSTPCVDRGIWDTGAGKSCAPEPRCCRCIPGNHFGSFGGRGTGDYRGELQAALQAVTRYLSTWGLPLSSGIVRVDGQYGDSSVIADIVATGVQIVVRKRGYGWLEHPRVQAALAHDPVATFTTQESQVTYEAFDLPHMLLDDGTTSVRLVLTRRAWKHGEPISVGKVVGDWVYEQFVTTLPVEGFLATDVLDLYQGRGAFEGTLADEDREGDPDRWCSFSASGQEVWQLVWQWVWNLRLALSAACADAPLRQMEWAPPYPHLGVERTEDPMATQIAGDEDSFGKPRRNRRLGSRCGVDVHTRMWYGAHDDLRIGNVEMGFLSLEVDFSPVLQGFFCSS